MAKANKEIEGNACKKKVLESLDFLREEVKDLYLPKQITVVKSIPEPLDFYRQWVAPNIPLLIKGGMNGWPALKKWNKNYFKEVLKDVKVCVAVTPNGYADAISETIIDGEPVECFTLPEERYMTISDFLTKLENGDNYSDPNVKESKGVFYIQKQNSNLTEYPELMKDIDQNLSWASQAFDSNPSAVNLWIGDERAVTSLHKDPFENIYGVVSGYKEFVLLPPTDRPWIPYKTLPVGQYEETSPGVFNIKLLTSQNWTKKDSEEVKPSKSEVESTTVPWIAVDPCSPDYVKYPLYRNASPITVKVEKGDLLYLPSLWFHHVRQSHQCIAVNFWYDMELDIKFLFYQFLENLVKSFDIEEK